MRPIDADKLFDDLLRMYGTEVVEWVADMFMKTVNAAPTIAPPPNEPLTLEQLREMDGEPVWNDTMKKWVLVDLTWEFGERTVDADGKWRYLDDRYYRRKPEEGAL